MIEITHLSKKFGPTKALDDVTVTFEVGKVYGIVGENGAGKTTFFRCLAGLEKHEGEITSAVQPLKDHLGFLLTEPYFFPMMTGREYIRLLANARKVILSQIDEKNIFDLPLDKYASTYSTGMKKKLALTAVLLQNSDVFILDEPFNGVDIQSNLIITEIILKLKSLGKTVIISSHIFSTLVAVCDEIQLMSSGRLTRTVTPDEFDGLEAEMKSVSVGNRVERLGLK